MCLVDCTSLSLDSSIWNPSQPLGSAVPFDILNISEKDKNVNIKTENNRIKVIEVVKKQEVNSERIVYIVVAINSWLTQL